MSTTGPLNGCCHCKNLSFTLRIDPDPPALPARACSCSFCQKHGAVWTSWSTATLAARVEDPSRLLLYAFETGTAQFYLCKTCGVVAWVTSTIEGHLYAVVNCNTFEDFDRSRLQFAPVSFDGESESVRLARRKRYWIASVGIQEGRT